MKLSLLLGEAENFDCVKGIFLVKNSINWAMVAHIFDPSNWKVEAGGSL